MQQVRAQCLSHRSFNADGAPGFDYDFNSIENDTNELFCAYREMFELAVSQNQNPMRQLLGIYFPIVNTLFVSEFYCMDHAFLNDDDLAGPSGSDNQEVPQSDMGGCGSRRPGEKEEGSGRHSERRTL